jgi:maltooligosyltrehalose trehalohydrolase
LVVRLFGGDGDDRLLLVNLGDELTVSPAPEPLLAPPQGRRWEILWSSEDPRYGGSGWAPLDDEERWRLAAHAACVARPLEERPAGE